MFLSRSFRWFLLGLLLVHGAHAAGGLAYRVADLDAGPPYVTGVYPSALTVFAGRLYFAGSTATAGREPWVSDGTAAGTEVLADLCAGRCRSVGAYPEAFVPFGGHLYFAACEAAACRLWRTGGDTLEPVFEGRVVQILPWQGALYYSTAEGEVYRTDGTGPGTRLLRTADLVPLSLIPADDEIFVEAVDFAFTVAPRPPQLWRTDGTPEGSWLVLEDPRLEVFPVTFDGRAVYRIDGPLRLTDGFNSRPLLPEPPFVGAVPLYVIDGALIVQALGPELWRTDGTAAGTALLAAGDAAAEGFVARTAAFQGEVYFVFGLQPRALMRTVGLSGTTAVYEFPEPIKDLRALDGSLYVAAGPGSFDPPRSLWRIEGLAAAPAPVFTLDEGSFSELTAFAGELYFRRSLPEGGELARVGAEGEVEPLTRLPFDPSANPRHLTRHRDRIVFETEDFRKWVSDGTSLGTFELQATYDPFDIGSSRRFVSVGEEAVLQGSRDFVTVDEGGGVVPIFDRLTGDERAVPGAIFVLGHGVFFFSFDQAGSVDLWRGDRDSGAIERLLEDLQVLARPGQGLEFAARGGAALVLLEGSAWWTDGTAGGTRRILDVTETCDCLLVDPVAAGSAFFFASRPNPRTEDPAWRLWRSDGTAAGTALLREIEPYDAARGIFLRDLVAAGERAFFVVTDGLSREDLWTSDGTPAGTLLLHDPEWTAPLELTAFDGRLLFTADDRVHGRELWTSDGTAAGTELFLDLFPGRRSSSPRHLTVIDGRLVFTADDGVHGAEPWVSDGTPAGTRLLEDVLPGLPPSDPEAFTAAGELVVFNAGDEETGFELWAMARAALAGELAAVFTATPQRSVQGKPVVFTDHSSGRPESWCWRFGDEAGDEPECGATTPEARHAYRQPGVYSVTLRVERTLPEGGTESSTASAEVEAVAFCKPCLLE